MLINLPYKTGDVVTMKLSSGEEIIAKLEEESTINYLVSKPRMLTATQQGIGLAPFMFTIPQDTNVNLNANSVMAITKSEEEFSKQYIQNTTGIAL